MAPYYSLLPSNGTKMRPPRRYILSTAAVLLFILIASSLWYKEETLCKISSRVPTCRNQSPAAFSTTLVHRNIAVASVFGFHFDVYLALVWTMQRVMNGEGNVQVYAETPFAYEFQNISDERGLYHGAFKDPAQLIPDLHRNIAIDMVVFGTCSVDVEYWQKELLAAWDARDDDHKFELVCIPHHQGAGNDPGGWHDEITPWARRNAIRVLPIAEHVANAFRKEFKDRSGSLDPKVHTAGYGLIPVDVHIPILDIPRLPDKSGRRLLSNVVIQGSFAEDRRAYPYIFKDLIRSLHEDPAAWGYLPLGEGPSFVYDNGLMDPPFKLHLVGSGWIDLPPELKNVVVFHVSLNYEQYYEVMGEMDVCVPAFGPSDEYYTVQASSTVAMCLEVNVPILVTRRMREAYTYIDDDRVAITTPAVMTEMDAIKALRTHNAADFLASDPAKSGRTMGSNAAVREAVEHMMSKDWVRSKAGFDSVKRQIWAENELVVMKILEDRR